MIFTAISYNETWLTCLLMDVMGVIAFNFLTGKKIVACFQFVNCQEGTLEFHSGINYILLSRTLKRIHDKQKALYSCGLFQVKGKVVTRMVDVCGSLPGLPSPLIFFVVV